MTEVSLQDLMRDMAKRIDTLDNAGLQGRSHKPDASGDRAEIDAYVGLDPVLGDLHRQYLEAKSQYKSLAGLRGRDDPMTDAAFDWMESAECAVQTRLIELRDNPGIRGQAEAVLLESKAEQDRQEKKRAALLKSKAEWLERRRRMTAEAARKDSEDGIFAMMFLLWMLQSVTAQVRYSLSLANSFRAVVDDEREYKAAS